MIREANEARCDFPALSRKPVNLAALSMINVWWAMDWMMKQTAQVRRRLDRQKRVGERMPSARACWVFRGLAGNARLNRHASGLQKNVTNVQRPDSHHPATLCGRWSVHLAILGRALIVVKTGSSGP